MGDGEVPSPISTPCHLWQVGELALKSREWENWFWSSPTAALGRTGPAPLLDSTAELCAYYLLQGGWIFCIWSPSEWTKGYYNIQNKEFMYRLTEDLYMEPRSNLRDSLNTWLVLKATGFYQTVILQVIIMLVILKALTCFGNGSRRLQSYL